MRSLLDILEVCEFEDDRLHELLLEVADLEAVEAEYLQVADSEEPMDDVFLLALVAEQEEFLVGLDEDCEPLRYLTCGCQPVRSSDYS